LNKKQKNYWKLTGKYIKLIIEKDDKIIYEMEKRLAIGDTNNIVLKSDPLDGIKAGEWVRVRVEIFSSAESEKIDEHDQLVIAIPDTIDVNTLDI